MWVAVGGANTTVGQPKLWYSKDPTANTWTAVTTPFTAANIVRLYDVAYSPKLKLFCAVGQDNTVSPGQVTIPFTSPDGINWTQQSAGIFIYSAPQVCIKWLPINQVFMMCGYGGTSTQGAESHYSSDGINWTSWSLAGSTTPYAASCVAEAPNGTIVFSCYQGTFANGIATPNGTGALTISSPSLSGNLTFSTIPSVSTTTINASAIYYSPTFNEFIINTNTASSWSIFSSADGTSFSQIYNLPVALTATWALYANNLDLCYAQQTAPSYTYPAYSISGGSWTSGASRPNFAMNRVAYGGGMFVGNNQNVTTTPVSGLYYSPDGYNASNWGPVASNVTAYGLCYSG